MEMAIPISREDREYINIRDTLVPVAEKCADQAWGARHTVYGIQREEWVAKWNRTFYKRMDELTREAMKCIKT